MAGRKRFRQLLMVSIALACAASAAEARVRLENICTVYGSSEIRLEGIGLVTGLNGTGDSGKNAVAMRALGQFLRNMNAPADTLKDLKDTKNVALVRVEAVIPRRGARLGQKLDCHITSLFDAADLRGGRLLTTPLEISEVSKPSSRPRTVAKAAGGVLIESKDQRTVGKIPGGASVQMDFVPQLVFGGYVTLLLHPDQASYSSAAEIARRINEDFELEAREKIARAVGASAVRVKVPKTYDKVPVQFVANVLDVRVDQVNTEARVVINAKSNVVVISGEVEFSPAVVKIDGLQIDTTVTPSAGNSLFAGVRDRRSPNSARNLRELIGALEDLQVPTKDVIAVIRELKASGKLHAKLIER